MNKRWMTVAVIALVLMMAVTANLAAQNSVLAITTHGLNSDDRDNYVNNPQSLGAVNKNMIFLTYLPSSGGSYFSSAPKGSFDIGAGLMFGDWRLGVNYTHRASKEYSFNDQTILNAGADPEVATDDTTTDNDSKVHANDQYYRLAANFGNRIWGVSNVFQWQNNVTNETLDTAVSTGPGSDSGTIEDVAGKRYDTVTAMVGSPPSLYTAPVNTWSDTIKFGMNLTNALDVFSAFPGTWFTAAFGIGKTQNGSEYDIVNNRTGTTNGKADSSEQPIGYTKTADKVESGTETWTRTNAKAYMSLTPSIVYNMGFKLNDNFTLAPRIVWNGIFNMYSNNAGGGSVKGYADYTVSGDDVKTVISVTEDTGTGGSYHSYTSTDTRTTSKTETSNTLVKSSTHQLQPHVQLNASFEGLGLGLRWSPQFTFGSSSSDQSGTYSETINTTSNVRETEIGSGYNTENYTSTTTTWSGSSVKNNSGTTDGSSTKTSQYQYANQFTMAGFYWLKPSKLRLNFGVRYTDAVINKVTTTRVDPRYMSTDTSSGSSTGTTVTISSTTYASGVDPVGSSSTTPGTATVTAATTTSTPQTDADGTGPMGPGDYGTQKTVSGSTIGLDMIPDFRLGATWMVSDNYNFDFYFGSGNGSNVSIDRIIPFNWGIQMNIKW